MQLHCIRVDYAMLNEQFWPHFTGLHDIYAFILIFILTLRQGIMIPLFFFFSQMSKVS